MMASRKILAEINLHNKKQEKLCTMGVGNEACLEHASKFYKSIIMFYSALFN